MRETEDRPVTGWLGILRLQEDKKKITWVLQDPALSKLWMAHWLKEVTVASWTQWTLKEFLCIKAREEIIAGFPSSAANWIIFSLHIYLHKDTSTKSWITHWLQASVVLLSWTPCPVPLPHSHSVCFCQTIPILLSTLQLFHKVVLVELACHFVDEEIESQTANYHLSLP